MDEKNLRKLDQTGTNELFTAKKADSDSLTIEFPVEFSRFVRFSANKADLSDSLTLEFPVELFSHFFSSTEKDLEDPTFMSYSS